MPLHCSFEDVHLLERRKLWFLYKGAIELNQKP